MMKETQREWRLTTRKITFERARIMAILNATPDSFSDGGRFFDLSSKNGAIDLNVLEDVAAQLVRDGADIFDVGGESTRPGAEPIDASEELRRVIPVVRALTRFNLPISIDTYRPEVAEAALDAGAEIVNDISAGRYVSRDDRFALVEERRSEEMAQVVARKRAAVVIMHMRGAPKTMQTNLRPYDSGVVQETLDFLRQRRAAFVEAGVEPDRIALDPGLGFGKSYEDNFAILRNAGVFRSLGSPLLVGHSRKSFLRATAARYDVARNVAPDANVARLDALTAQTSVALVARGVDILRVHNVAATALALELARRAGAFES